MNQYYRNPAIRLGLIRVILFLLVWLVCIAIVEFFGLRWIEEVFPKIDQRSIPFQSIARSFSFLISLLIVFIFRKWIDRRPFLSDWFSLTNRRIDILVGFIAGAVMISLGAFILGQLSYIRFTPGQLSGLEFCQYLIFFLIVSLFEEIIFRGYVLENLLEDMHPAFALIISSALFMALHLLNPNVEVLPILNLFLAGLLLGASFIYTKNLWFPVGLHWSWNLFQGPIFGFEVSGINFKSFFEQTILKENIWTGGLFGFEGSILATFIIVIATFVILYVFQSISTNENS